MSGDIASDVEVEEFLASLSEEEKGNLEEMVANYILNQLDEEDKEKYEEVLGKNEDYLPALLYTFLILLFMAFLAYLGRKYYLSRKNKERKAKIRRKIVKKMK